MLAVEAWELTAATATATAGTNPNDLRLIVAGREISLFFIDIVCG